MDEKLLTLLKRAKEQLGLYGDMLENYGNDTGEVDTLLGDIDEAIEENRRG